MSDSLTEDDGLFYKLKDWIVQSNQKLSDWRTEAEEDYAFVSGDQWSEDDVRSLKEQLRPVITFNRIGPIIDSVAGMEVGNRQDIHYYPRGVEDSGLSELLNSAAKFFRQEADAEDEESDAFLDTVICGMGWVETRPEYEYDPEGCIAVERLDPLSCFWDTAAKKKNLVDRRYCGYTREMDIEDAQALFPDADPGDLHAGWAEYNMPATVQQKVGPKAYQEGKSPDYTRDRVTLAYIEWWDRERVVTVTIGEQTTEVSEEKFQVLSERLYSLNIPFTSVTNTKKIYKRAFLGNKVLEYSQGRSDSEFSLNCITGKRDRNNNSWYGLVRGMKDPQSWANKLFSQILHIINSNAKGGVVVEKTAVANMRDFEDTWSDPSGVTYVEDGAIARGQIKDKPAVVYPQGMDNLLQFAITSIRDGTGVNVEMLGLADRQQAGVLEYQRKQAGITILAPIFDALRRYRKISGRITMEMIYKYIPEGRLVRIDSDNGPQYAPLVKDRSALKYDVVVDDAPTSPNQKEIVWATVNQMMPFLSRQPVPVDIWADILKYSPLPQAVSAKIGEKLMAAANQPPPPDPKIELLKQQAMIKQQENEANQQMRLQEHAMQMKMDQQKSMHDMALADMQMKAQIEMDRQKMLAELAIKDIEASHNAAIEQNKAEQEHNHAERQMKQNESLGKALEPLIKTMAQVAEAMSEASANSREAIHTLTSEMRRPKKVIRDSSGRAVGVH